MVSYSNKSVKLYSFEHIVQRVRKRVCCTLLSKLNILFNQNFKHCIRNTFVEIYEYLHIQCFINLLAHLAAHLCVSDEYFLFFSVHD